MAYSNLDGFSVEGPAPARIAPKHVMKGGVYTISSGLFTARDTHAIASMCLQRGLRRRLAVEDLMESVFSYQYITWRSGLGELPVEERGSTDRPQRRSVTTTTGTRMRTPGITPPARPQHAGEGA